MKDFHKNYHGHFHYPPEYAQQTEGSNSKILDTETIEWEIFDEVCLWKEFIFNRPNSSHVSFCINVLKKIIHLSSTLFQF